MIPLYDQLPAAPGGARSAWNVFGVEDCIGRLNLQTADTMIAGSKLVRRGRCFSLNAPLDLLSPPRFVRGPVRRRTLTLRDGRAMDDVIDNYHPQGSCQWDALARVPYKPGVFYNGAAYQDVRATAEHYRPLGKARYRGPGRAPRHASACCTSIRHALASPTWSEGLTKSSIAINATS